MRIARQIADALEAAHEEGLSTALSSREHEGAADGFAQGCDGRTQGTLRI
jgi:hypothetical protein